MKTSLSRGNLSDEILSLLQQAFNRASEQVLFKQMPKRKEIFRLGRKVENEFIFRRKRRISDLELSEKIFA